MAYNPGNENMSGQILGNSLTKALDSLASAYVQRDQQKEQDKIFNARSKATEGAIKSFLPGEKANEILRVDPKESPEARHSRLLDTVQNFVVESNIQAKQAEQAERERKARQQATDSQAMMAAMNQFVAPDQGAQIQGGTSFANLQQPGAQKQAFNPAQFMQAYTANKGSPESLDKVDSFMKMMMPQAGKPVMNLSTYRDTDAKGNRVDVTRDQFTGDIIGKADAPFQTQPEVPNLLVGKQYDDFSLERKEKVMPAMQSLNVFRNIKPILESGEFTSGPNANLELGTRKLVTMLGGNPDPKVSNSEFLRAQLAIPMMAMVKNLGSGTAVSDKDLEFVAKAAAGEATLDGESIKRIVRVGEQMANEVVGNYQERLDSTFPGDTKNEQYKQARASLKLPSRKAATVDSLLEKYK